MESCPPHPHPQNVGPPAFRPLSPVRGRGKKILVLVKTFNDISSLPGESEE